MSFISHIGVGQDIEGSEDEIYDCRADITLVSVMEVGEDGVVVYEGPSYKLFAVNAFATPGYSGRDSPKN